MIKRLLKLIDYLFALFGKILCVGAILTIIHVCWILKPNLFLWAAGFVLVLDLITYLGDRAEAHEKKRKSPILSSLD